MPIVPVIPESAPFNTEQRAWLNGFLAGILSSSAVSAAGTGTAESSKPLLILFGSQSGNAESLAKKIGREAQSRGYTSRVTGLEGVEPASLSREPRVLLITSTWGEGEMPDNAKTFWHGISNGTSPRLEGVHYSVLALGDKNYGDTFCFAGKAFDERFEQLGAVRLHPRAECDVEFEAPAAEWLKGVFEALEKAPASSSSQLTLSPSPAPQLEAPKKKNTAFPSPLLQKRCLNKAGSAKDVWHIEFSLAGSGLTYEVGDALGVMPENCPRVVETVLKQHGYSGNETVPLPDGGSAPLHDALLRAYEVRSLLGGAPSAPVAPEQFVDGLKTLRPRLYSISSSPKAHPDEVHLTIGAVRYTIDGQAHQGVCSTFIADRLTAGQTAGVHVQTSHGFRLPADGGVDSIMIGPGTGIAPFRAFLEERQAVGAPGRNWLFFGDQKKASDFLYEDQITSMHQAGFLTRLDLAFSRDQTEKIYVQDRMRENAAELWKWLENGAHLYVCGDASRMAKDVDATLHTIVRKQGGRSEDDAVAYVKSLKSAKRYQRDVY